MNGSNTAILVSLQQDLTVIGLRYLHYALLDAGVDSHYLHLPRFDPSDGDALEHLRQFVGRVRPLFVGISLMSTEFHAARQLTGYLKMHFPTVPVVWGGVHPTLDPEGCVPFADFACIGEGERVVVRLARALADGQDPRTLPSLCYLEDGIPRRNPTLPLVDDLDTLPTYEHIPRNGFLQQSNGTIARLDERLATRYGRYQHKFYDVLTSRGCPFSCTYCCSGPLSQIVGSRRVRRRSLENIIAEIERAVRDFPSIQLVNFHDENFLSHDLAFLQAFAGAYRERVGKPFMVACIPLYVTHDKMKLAKEAGLVWIRMGLQSGSDRVLRDVYRRKSTSRHFLAAAKVLDDLEIAAYCDVILDNPFESVDDQVHTIDTLLATPRPFYLQLYSLSAYYGSELRARMLKECPEKLEDATEKDYLVYRRHGLNELTRLAAYIPRSWVRAMTGWYREDSASRRFRVALPLAKAVSALFFEPITHFRVFKRSQQGSLLRVFRALPAYGRIWLDRFFRQWADA